MAKRRLVDIGSRNYRELLEIRRNWAQDAPKPSIPWLTQQAIAKAIPMIRKELGLPTPVS